MASNYKEPVKNHRKEEHNNSLNGQNVQVIGVNQEKGISAFGKTSDKLKRIRRGSTLVVIENLTPLRLKKR